uniref:inorganic diphosphatase n=1 Tax=Peronospora matthiolae TaxID=2874970 RepID=A0AAV1UXD1_9STRA
MVLHVSTLRARVAQVVRAKALHTVRRCGQHGTLDCRYFFYDNNERKQSPWHHVPLFAGSTTMQSLDACQPALYYFVNEIPKGSRHKMEIAGDEAFNPIKQDERKGVPRLYHSASLVNYGCLPQTWEDPRYVDEATKHGGDNDPIDVCEIGTRVAEVGAIYPVKVLGILGMIDSGETDWKVIAINANDPLAEQVNDLRDLHKTPLHDVVSQVHRWFRDYKIPDGKPPSDFAFNGEAQPREFAVDVIQQTHESWKQLTRNEAVGNPKLWTSVS